MQCRETCGSMTLTPDTPPHSQSLIVEDCGLVRDNHQRSSTAHTHTVQNSVQVKPKRVFPKLLSDMQRGNNVNTGQQDDTSETTALEATLLNTNAFFLINL